MELKTQSLVVIYGLAAVLALVFTWYHVPAYLGNGIVEANRLFWNDALFNTSPSGKFLTVDILFLAFVCNVWMFIEGRRLGVRFLYVYVIAGILVAISVAFPLFMAARELKLSAANSQPPGYSIKIYDVFALLVIFASAIVAGVSVM